jgi:hypothetical protein
MFSISKAFRVFSLVLAAVLVPATAFAGTTGWTVAKQGQAQARPNKAVKLKKKGTKVAKADKANKPSKDKAGQAKRSGSPKIKVVKRGR